MRGETDRFAPRALLHQPTIPVDLYPVELHRLIRLIEDDGLRAAEHPAQEGYAHWCFQRARHLREAGR